MPIRLSRRHRDRSHGRGGAESHAPLSDVPGFGRRGQPGGSGRCGKGVPGTCGCGSRSSLGDATDHGLVPETSGFSGRGRPCGRSPGGGDRRPIRTGKGRLPPRLCGGAAGGDVRVAGSGSRSTEPQRCCGSGSNRRQGGSSPATAAVGLRLRRSRRPDLVGVPSLGRRHMVP